MGGLEVYWRKVFEGITGLLKSTPPPTPVSVCVYTHVFLHIHEHVFLWFQEHATIPIVVVEVLGIKLRSLARQELCRLSCPLCSGVGFFFFLKDIKLS